MGVADVKNISLLMKWLCTWAILSGLLFWSCGGGEGAAPGAGGKAGPALVVRQPHFLLQEEAGEGGRGLRELAPGTLVYPLGQHSGFTTSLRRGSYLYNEPWLLVETPEGEQGWVYAAAFLEPGGSGEEALGWRLNAILGNALAARLQAFNSAFDTLSSEKALLAHLSAAYGLRDSLLLAASRSAGEGQGLFGLKSALPLFVPYRFKKEREVYLFLDFRPYIHKAASTPGPADDHLLAFCAAAYPEDSIEYFFPSWTIEDEEGRGHSLLGRGIHFNVLSELDKLLIYNDLMQEEIGRFRGLILNDLTAAGVTYWEAGEKALAELDSIRAAGFAVLGANGAIALEARRAQFAEPEKYGIQFNHRSGIYE